MPNINSNDSTSILAQAIEEMKKELGNKFSLEKINLAELERRTGISRKKLRRLKKNGFIDKPDPRKGKKAKITILSGYTGIIDTLMKKNVSNSTVIFERLQESGYPGGLTQVKTYIAEHKYLLPAKRQFVSPQGNRGRRYQTGPGEAYEMDWGFVNVVKPDGMSFQVACFAMICHYCGERYIEFFTNAKQENLFIGMIHAFSYMGVPQHVLTDNMKSVVIRRDSDGHPIWQKDYEIFMKAVGFETRLCKPRHPFTKGAVERLVRFVKENFIVGREFTNLTDLNEAALNWCEKENNKYHKALECIPTEKHYQECLDVAKQIEHTMEVLFYLCPARSISFDGFVSYEAYRYGVPYWYTEKVCRVKREQNTIYIFSADLSQLLTTHLLTWGKRDNYCKDQYLDCQPEEKPSMPVKVELQQLQPPKKNSAFSKFNFDSEDYENE